MIHSENIGGNGGTGNLHPQMKDIQHIENTQTEIQKSYALHL